MILNCGFQFIQQHLQLEEQRKPAFNSSIMNAFCFRVSTAFQCVPEEFGLQNKELYQFSCAKFELAWRFQVS